jgi:CheY-like chemotaxis protein
MTGVEIALKARPSVITLDLDLLEDGFGMIARIKGVAEGDKSEAPMVIAISSNADLERETMDAGADAFVKKPIERVDLIAVIERANAPSPARVLVVDDDVDALDLVVAMLDGSGYEICTAASGNEAMDEILRARPDAVILDLMLPGMDGFEIVHRLSLTEEGRDIPVILLTARDLSHEEHRALDTGTARIIQKGSFTREELLAEIKVAIGERAKRAAQRSA